MAGSVNKVILIGNVGKDPEVRATQDGREIVNLSIATSESWKDRGTGERKEKTEWHRVVIFSEGLVSVCKNYLRKGSKVYLEGQLQTRKWTDKDGVEKSTTEIVLQNYNSTLTMLDGKKDEGGGGYGNNSSSAGNNNGGGDNYNSGNGGNYGGANQSRPQSAPDLDDDIPF